jgi:hypothetical protein
MIVLAVISAGCLISYLYGLLNNMNIISPDSLNFIFILLFLLAFCTAAGITIFISFRNTASAEIFFFYIFIFAVIFDTFKIAFLVLPPSEITLTYGMLATKLVYFGRFLGALSLFSAGLFATGLEYQRTGMVFIASIIASATLVWLLPVDSTSIVPGNTWELGNFHEMIIAVGLFEAMGVINFLIAGMKSETLEYRIIAAGLLTAAAGREILYFIPGIILPAAGYAALVAGTVIFSRQVHRLYLWE